MLKYKLIFYLLIALLTVSGVLIMNAVKKSFVKIRIRNDRFNQLRAYLTKKTNEKEVDNLLNEAGLHIDTFHFQLVRYSVLTLWCVLCFLSYKIRNNPPPYTQVLIAFLLFYIISPQTKVMKKDTPFKLIMKTIADARKYNRNLELFRLISQLKNFAITFNDDPPSSYFLLEQLRKFSVTLRPVLNTVIKEWNEGNKDIACDYFFSAIGTQQALDFSNLMRKLDNIKPIEIKQQLIVLQEGIFSEMETKRTKLNEYRGYFIYGVSIIILMLVLYNFVVVGFLIDGTLLNQYF